MPTKCRRCGKYHMYYCDDRYSPFDTKKYPLWRKGKNKIFKIIWKWLRIDIFRCWKKTDI